MLISVVLRVETPHSGSTRGGESTHPPRWPAGASNDSGVRCEAGEHIRLRPTARQQVALGQCLASHRELSNAAPQERRDAWRLRNTTVSSGDQSAQLRAIREARPDVKAWSFSSQQATLRRLNRAFAGFFRRVNVGQTPGHPRFKPAHRFDSVEWPKDGDGCRRHADTRKVYRQGIGQVKVTVTGLHRSIHDAGRARFVSILRAKAEAAGRVVIDVDARHTSDRCGACGHTAKENRAGQAVFACRRCGHTRNADEHAAGNILRAGLARLAADPAA